MTRKRFLQGFCDHAQAVLVLPVLSVALGALARGLVGSRIAMVRGAVDGFVQLFRNTPPLVQLYFFYFALGPVLPKIDGATGARLVRLGGGFADAARNCVRCGDLSRRHRSGAEGDDRGCAGAGLLTRAGVSPVVLPLAVRVTMPAMTNNLVNLVKTTTLAYAIAVPELVYMSAQVWSEQVNVPEMMIVLLLSLRHDRRHHQPVDASS